MNYYIIKNDSVISNLIQIKLPEKKLEKKEAFVVFSDLGETVECPDIVVANRMLEKEVLRLCVIEEEKDSETLFQEEREMFQNGDAVFIKGETWIDRTMTIQWLQEDFYYYSFLKEVNNKVCYGIFRVHKYRKKAWENIIPQLIETVSDREKEE